MRDPYPLPVHALISNSPRARARYLLHLLNAEPLCEDRWRLPGGTVIWGRLEDLVYSVDCVKQIEQWLVAREESRYGYSELSLKVDYCTAGWIAEIVAFHGAPVLESPCQERSEALARVRVLIEYVRSVPV